MSDYYLQTWYILVSSRVAKQPMTHAHGTFAAGRAYLPTQEKKKKKTYNLRKLGNIRKVSKLHRHSQSLCQNENLLILAKNP